MPDPLQWQKIKEIVGAALERDSAQRSAFLDEACSNDSAIRAEVDSLLSAYKDADPLSKPGLTTELADLPATPKSIGPYQLLRKLGEGGMGQVWLAEQTSPVRRKVALKLIKTGIFDDTVLRRFQTERQSLAIMDHPAIAKVFDAGATPDGQPYFVMEYVPGLPITEYCDKHKLKISERLELFIRACEGVQHAHQKALIHRDLKPANILVIEVDGKPQPRIIDFGLAKSVTPYFGGDFAQTRVGAFVGTPGYMSPEQADPGALDIDTRTDVYSLGVILYELLTGFLPFDPSTWKKLRLEELLRHLREANPVRPSTKVTNDRNSSLNVAAARNIEPAQLATLLRGDLDWITLKTLDKDRNRRYATPNELASDITRYLHNEPILARPATTSYRLRKYLRRNRVAVSGVSILVILLAVFGTLQTIQLRRTTRERDRANRIADFMGDMFKVSNPSEARGKSITAKEILDKSSKDIQNGLSKDPDLQAQMLDLMGRVYWHLGLLPTAKDLISRAVEIRRRTLGSQSPDTLFSLVSLANVLGDQGALKESDQLYREVLAAPQRVLGPTNKTRLAAMNGIALDLTDETRFPEAEKIQRDTLEIYRRTTGPESLESLTILANLSLTLKHEGRYAEAEKLNREVLEARRRTLGPDHPDTLAAANNLTLILLDEQGHQAEAESLARSTLDIRQRILGPSHMDTIESMNTLGAVLGVSGKSAEKEALLRQTLKLEMDTLGPEHRKTLDTMNNLAAGLLEEQKFREATALFRQLLDTQRRLHGPENYTTLVSQTNLAAVLQDQKLYPEAITLGREALGIERQKLGNKSLITLFQMYNLAICFEESGQPADAQKLLQETIEHQSEVFGLDNPQTARSTYLLGLWAARRGDSQQAFELLQHAIDHGLGLSWLANLDSLPELKSLHTDPRYPALIASARQHAATQQTH